MVISAEVVSELGYTNTYSHTSVTCHCCSPEFLLFVTLQVSIPHFVWPRNTYIMWPGRIFLTKCFWVLFFFCWLKLCFPLNCLFISYQSAVLDQIMAWQTLVPYISLFTSDNPYLFFCFFVSGNFVKDLKCLHMEWFILCCLLSLTQVSMISQSFHTLDRAAKSYMQVKLNLDETTFLFGVPCWNKSAYNEVVGCMQIPGHVHGPFLSLLVQTQNHL